MGDTFLSFHFEGLGRKCRCAEGEDEAATNLSSHDRLVRQDEAHVERFWHVGANGPQRRRGHDIGSESLSFLDFIRWPQQQRPTGRRSLRTKTSITCSRSSSLATAAWAKRPSCFRYADDSFTPAFVSTVGIDFKVKTIYRNDKRIKLQIWDTAGQERYRTITTAYYRGAMGFILMYDITNEESFNAVQDWSTQIKTYSWDNAQVLLVGNKCDMDDERVVSGDRGRQLADHLGFEFFEASAKDNINVKQTFERLVDIICEKMSESLDAGDPTVTGAKQGPQLTEQPAPPHQDCAC
ncbi:unnamed protein product, partial [Tetraodon nigroviridis]